MERWKWIETWSNWPIFKVKKKNSPRSIMVLFSLLKSMRLFCSNSLIMSTHLKANKKTRQTNKNENTEMLTWTCADITHFKIGTGSIRSLFSIQTRDSTAWARGFIQLKVRHGFSVSCLAIEVRWTGACAWVGFGIALTTWWWIVVDPVRPTLAS